MKALFLIMLLMLSLPGYSNICPDPQNSSLEWGVPPSPWEESPFSPNPPQGEENTAFVQADILVVGRLGKAVVCTYQNSIGKFAIWWQVRTKVPAPVDYHWIETTSGYVCVEGLSACQFHVAP